MNLPCFKKVESGPPADVGSVRFPMMLLDPNPLMIVADAMRGRKEGHFAYIEPEIEGNTMYITFWFVPKTESIMVD